LDLLKETKLTEEQQKYVARVGQSADRLHALINDSLELVSAETGQMPVKLTGINLKKLVAELSKDFEGALEKKGMRIDTAFDAADVKTDSKALKSVMTRLLDNAIKFGHENSTIEVGAREADNGKVQVSLVNEGKAVKAETIAKILKPFALDENIMNHTKGTGLGLSVVQAVLRRLGSQLEVQSPKGKFEATFSLPAG
jgi:signal transduction histidine kinase